jgi:hypothetical protein
MDLKNVQTVSIVRKAVSAAGKAWSDTAVHVADRDAARLSDKG